jgi:drug/metabolite transporter (DMT)-like permease
MRTGNCTGLALAAFAANSVLCRMALGEAAIDAGSFSAIRLASGAAALLLILAVREGGRVRPSGSWVPAGWLFLYAVAFSFAYLDLSTGTGALILFGSVQATMILAAVWAGDRPDVRESAGMLMALGGLGYLASPGLAAPSLTGALLMAAAGGAWGAYSLRGRGVADPLADTAGNFVRTLPLAAGLGLLALRHSSTSAEGVLLAVVSGALTSGVGYALWYAALRGLSAARAAVVQLSVPVLAAGGGVAFLSEEISTRLILAAVLILGGVGLALRGGEKRRHGDLSPVLTLGRADLVGGVGLPRD